MLKFPLCPRRVYPFPHHYRNSCPLLLLWAELLKLVFHSTEQNNHHLPSALYCLKYKFKDVIAFSVLLRAPYLTHLLANTFALILASLYRGFLALLSQLILHSLEKELNFLNSFPFYLAILRCCHSEFPER